jgi:DNA-binding MarR family transcriptional regulator
MNIDNDSRKLIDDLGLIANDPALKSSSRLLLLIILYINGKMTFSELLHATSMSKGSLSNHIEKLEEMDLIKTRSVFKLSGPRVIVEITNRGMDKYKKYIELINRLSTVSEIEKNTEKKDSVDLNNSVSHIS